MRRRDNKHIKHKNKIERQMYHGSFYLCGLFTKPIGWSNKRLYSGIWDSNIVGNAWKISLFSFCNWRISSLFAVFIWGIYLVWKHSAANHCYRLLSISFLQFVHFVWVSLLILVPKIEMAKSDFIQYQFDFMPPLQPTAHNTKH